MSEDAEISNEQLAWCDRLWSSLRVGGKWQLPNVGIYIKTSDESLTLTELYFSRPTPDAFGNTALILTIGSYKLQPSSIGRLILT